MNFRNLLVIFLILLVSIYSYADSGCVDCGQGGAIFPDSTAVCDPSSVPTSGQVLEFDGTCWDAATDDTGAGGSAIVLDLGDDAANESADLSEIATTGDTNSIFTEPSADKLLIAVGNNWPQCDLAVSATNATTADALSLNPTDCGANQFADAIAANGNLTCNAIVDADVPNNITIDLAAQASAFAANPTDCSANQYATTIASNGNLTCAQVTGAQVANTPAGSIAATDVQAAINELDTEKEPSGAFSGTGACGANTYATTLNDGSAPTCSSIALNDLSNVSVPTPGTGEVLEWNGSSWVPSTDDTGTSNPAIILDLADDDVNESTALTEIAITGDTNGIVSEPAADKMLFNMGLDWPKADDADDVTCTGCVSNAELATDYITEVELDTFSELNTQITDATIVDLSSTQTLTNKTLDGESNTLQQRRDATSCTTETGGKAGELCYEEDAETIFICEPSVGDCDTAGEWKQVNSLLADALAADPADCSANQYANAIGANGDLSCAQIAGTQVTFSDSNGDFIATEVDSAIEEFVTTNVSGPNAADGKVNWEQLVNVPAGFADGTDDGGGGTPNILDLGDDASNESTDLIEIATTGDTNSIFTEPAADKLLIAVGNNWPTADTADALTNNPTDCSANQFANAIVANGNLTCAAILDADVPNNITIDLATEADGLSATGESATETYTNKTIDGNSNTLSTLRHATDCTGITTGVDGQFCYEQDSDNWYVCEPTVGGCDTAAEWRLTNANNALTADALSADPADCSAGLFTSGINASGVAQGCTDLISEAELTSLVDLNTQLGGINIVDTGTLTDGQICTWDNAGSEIDCITAPGGFNLTVEEADLVPTVSNVDTIQFDQADGFTVTDETGGQVQVDLASVPDSVLATDYSGTGSCTNQFVRVLNDAGAPTCATVDDASVDDTITVSNYCALSGGANCTMTGEIIADNLGIEFTESDTNPTCAAGNYNIFADLSETAVKICNNGTAEQVVTPNNTVTLTNKTLAAANNVIDADTAVALASNPTDCSANQFANAIVANGNLTCAAITDADVPDTITASNYLLLAGGTLTGQLVTDNLGIEFAESDTNPTCGAGNYNIYADTSETSVNLCNNGTAAEILTKTEKLTRCMYISDVTSADTNILMGSWFNAVTITDVWCNYEGSAPSTVAQFSLEDGSGNAMTHTTPVCAAPGTAATSQSISAGGALTARENLRFDVDNTPNPATDEYTLCVAYTID